MTQSMSDISIFPIKAFEDNYIWCIHDHERAVVVDPGDAKPVLDYLTQHSLLLSEILITHHHYDHTGGIQRLCEAVNHLTVIGPHNPKISGLTAKVREGDTVSVLSDKVSFDVIETPGHTMDHIAFYNDHWLFCGDTLFSVGCGRMFEGTPEIFLASLDKLAALPSSLAVYCTHEYTLANLQFARHLLPHDSALSDYEQWAKQMRAQGEITLPSSIAQQKHLNPYLRCHDKAFQQIIAEQLAIEANEAGTDIARAISTFAAIRSAKDHF
ncbi:hydroxyacylglutathione hydrolase [Ningiella sp. W23]|uniref:hydroxyacylglutathione hydrolase n=1 Tax=Ningiella sp. W23 TaxID=3023715 RepID=UPI003756FBB4